MFRKLRAFGDSRTGECQGGFGLLQIRYCLLRCLGAPRKSVLNADVVAMRVDLELKLCENRISVSGVELLKSNVALLFNGGDLDKGMPACTGC